MLLLSCVADDVVYFGVYHHAAISQVPPNSRANRQKEFFDSAFSPFFRVNQVGNASRTN